MSQHGDLYEQFLNRFVLWTEARADIRGVVLVGSRARTVQPADEFSDLDLMLITTKPKFYFETDEWLRELGELSFTYRQPPIVGGRNVRTAIYEGRVNVDFAMVSDLESRWAGAMLRLLVRFPRLRRLLPRSLDDEVEAWFAILRKGTPPALVNKGGAAMRMHGIRPPGVRASTRAPTQREFDELVAAFWSHCMWTSKLVLRGELWMAVFVSDRLIKSFLLQMIEWHAAAQPGVAGELWYNGRFLERRTDERVLRQLATAFPQYDERAIWDALAATMDLFSMVTRETASRLRISYGESVETKVRAWIADRAAKPGDA